MTSILWAMIQLAGMQAAMAATGIVRNKVLALRLGPEGFGVFAQLLSVTVLIYTFTKFGLAVGLSRYVAAAKTNADKQRYLDVANTIVMSASLAVWLGYALFPGYFLESVGVTTPVTSISLLLLMVVVPIDALQNNYLGFLQGELDIKGIASQRTIGILFATVCGIPVVWYFGIIGAALQATLVSAYMAWLLGRRCAALGYHPLRFKWHSSTMAALATMGAASLLSGVAHAAVDVIVRNNMIHQLGASRNGIYQAAITLTGQVMTIILGSIGAYSLAAVSKGHGPEETSIVVNDILSTVARVAAIALGALALSSHLLLRLLFAPEFGEAQRLFVYLTLGDYVRTFVWVIGAPLLARGYLGTWLSLELILAGVRGGMTIWLLKPLGVNAMVIGYLVAWCVHLLLNLAWFVGPLKLHLDVETVSAVLLGGTAVLSVGWAGAQGQYAVGALVFVVYLAIAVKPTEWRRLFQLIPVGRKQ